MALSTTSFDRHFAVGFIVRESNGIYSYSATEVKRQYDRLPFARANADGGRP